MTNLDYGFRILGSTKQARHLIEFDPCWRAYLECDERAEVASESYLSAFRFGDDFRTQLESERSTSGFNGACGADFIWFDIDRASDLIASLRDARLLHASIVERLEIRDDDLLVFFSGSKGFHIGIPTGLWEWLPSDSFHRQVRAFATTLAESAGIRIDTSIYDKVRAFRAPNSRHPVTGIHKRHLSRDELFEMSIESIFKLAESPEVIEWEAPSNTSPRALELWTSAGESLRAAGTQYGSSAHGEGGLNAATIQFIREGAETGERQQRLYSAAANLTEPDCSDAVVHGLLFQSARDCGLRPKEIVSTITDAIKANRRVVI